LKIIGELKYIYRKWDRDRTGEHLPIIEKDIFPRGFEPSKIEPILIDGRSRKTNGSFPKLWMTFARSMTLPMGDLLWVPNKF
jgi:hypothetical protein